MKQSLTLAAKELRGYFNSAVGWLFVIVFLVASSSLFFLFLGFFAADRADLRDYFSLMPLLLSFLLPALTMRSWAEEKKQGTYEFLLTMPYTEQQLVLGKYLATMAVILFTLVLTLPVPLMISLFGSLDGGKLLTEYVGILLLASASAAIGQLISALSKNQISAFIVSVLVLSVLNLLSMVPATFSLPSWLATVVAWLSLNHHFISFSRGMLDTRDVLYFAILSGGALYLTAKMLVFGRWR